MENQNRNKLARKNRQQRLVLERDELRAEIARLTRERDEAVRVAVWAANNVHGVMLGNRGRTEIHFWAPDGVPESVTCDGTDADIYRALREAMGEAMGASEGSEER